MALSVLLVLGSFGLFHTLSEPCNRHRGSPCMISHSAIWKTLHSPCYFIVVLVQKTVLSVDGEQVPSGKCYFPIFTWKQDIVLWAKNTNILKNIDLFSLRKCLPISMSELTVYFFSQLLQVLLVLIASVKSPKLLFWKH